MYSFKELNTESYIDQKKEIQEIIISFIDNDDLDDLDDFQEVYQNQTLGDDKYKLKLLLHLIIKIANNHHRSDNFFERIEKILLFIKKDIIERELSGEEIFNISASNKRITLFFIENKLIDTKKNSLIANLMLMNKHRDLYYPNYFYPEIKDHLNVKEREEIEKVYDEYNIDEEIFKINRKIGENHKYICKLIRSDSVEEFIAYVNRNLVPLNYRIEPSIFETNVFLIKNKPNLIEYAAFFGAIEIMKFLFYTRNDLLKPSLWNYVIHGRNPELIHFLEENRIETIDKCYSGILCESIKCHHNEITNYFLDNFVDDNQKDSNFFSTIMKSYNFQYFPKDLSNSFIYFHLCKNDYYELVKDLQSPGNTNIDFKTISIFFIF